MNMSDYQMKEKLNLNNLIAISGVRGSGKDLCTDMLQYCLSVPYVFRQYWVYRLLKHLIKPKYKRIAFADPLKRMLAILLNEPYESFNSRSFKECYIVDLTDLRVHFAVGSLSDSKFNKLVKELDPELSQSDLSIRQLMQYFGTEVMHKYFGRNVWINSTLKHASKRTIISDLRFKAEADAVHEKKGVIIYISRPGYTFGQHASEKEMSELLSTNQYDYVIDNNGTQKDLFNKIKDLCNDK